MIMIATIERAAKIKALGRIVLLAGIAIYGAGLIIMRMAVEKQDKSGDIESLEDLLEVKL